MKLKSLCFMTNRIDKYTELQFRILTGERFFFCHALRIHIFDMEEKYPELYTQRPHDGFAWWNEDKYGMQERFKALEKAINLCLLHQNAEY